MDVCLEIMERLVKMGYSLNVHAKGVEQAIIYVRGPDRRTIENWKRALETLGFLKMKVNGVYEMNLSEYPDLLVKVIHEKGQKRLL